jgi:hypothetical protein
MSVASLTGKQGWSEPRCVDDPVNGFGFGARSEITGEPEEDGEEGDERGAFPGRWAGTVEVRADVGGLVVVCELGVRRHGGGRGLKCTGHEL